MPQVDVTGVGAVQPAPDKLTQVERASLVKFPDGTPASQPWHPAGEAPDTLSQVERGQLVKLPPKPIPGFVEGSDNAIANPAAGVIPPTPKPAYPDKIVTPDEASGAKSVVNAPVAAARAPVSPVTPADSTKPSTSAAEEPSSLFGMPIAGREQAAAKPAAVNPDGTPFPERVQAVGGDDPKAFVVHHTGGRLTLDGLKSTFRENGLGVEFFMDRGDPSRGIKPKIYQVGGPGAQNIKAGWGPKGTGLNNSNVVGMEISANNDADVTEDQKQLFAQFMAARYPTTTIYGHGEVNPGHKEADEGISAKNSALALRESGGAGPVVSRYGKLIPEGQEDTTTATQPQGTAAAPAGKFVSGRATTFGYHDPEDEGVGSPKLGEINTNDGRLVGVAVPEQALRRQFGSDEGAWRRARVEVVGTDGQHYLMPIVDLGPKDTSKGRGVAADLTHGAAVLLHHDDSNQYQFRIIPDAGPDAKKEPGAFIAEQGALAAGKTYQPQTADGAVSSRYGKLIPEALVPPPTKEEQAQLKLKSPPSIR